MVDREVPESRQSVQLTNECCLPRDRSGKANARRARIVQAARELFAEHGFHATSIARLSERSGVLVGQIYRDFANKEAIVAALVEHDLDEFLAADELCAARCTSDRAMVRAWIARFIACDDIGDTRLIAEITAESYRNPRIAAIFDAMEDRLHGQLVRALTIIVPDAGNEQRIGRLAEAILIMAGGMCQRRINTRSTAPEVLALMMAFIDAEIAAIERDPRP
ncbi:TetR/AcrR family transcriptional regulator [Sphingomonas endophytica]|uniref:TetR/AcrR family transcriptional regulator n=1 Tax=Sphingomonas endophytica TaxID=869719 RepID=UPI0009FAFD74|nr:TetR/AcrR family transcriptional regulator [Sphingomonas endophytica]